MPDLDDPAPPQPVPHLRSHVVRRAPFRFWLAMVRLFAVVGMLFLIAQPIWIGQYLAGVYTWLGVHSAGGILAVGSGILLLVASFGYAVCGGRRQLPPVVVILIAAEILQVHEGFVRNLAVHIPLGVFVIVAGVALAVASCTRWAAGPGVPADDRGDREAATR